MVALSDDLDLHNELTHNSDICKTCLKVWFCSQLHQLQFFKKILAHGAMWVVTQLLGSPCINHGKASPHHPSWYHFHYCHPHNFTVPVSITWFMVHNLMRVKRWSNLHKSHKGIVVVQLQIIISIITSMICTFAHPFKAIMVHNLTGTLWGYSGGPIFTPSLACCYHGSLLA
jgi:hypothetical protein